MIGMVDLSGKKGSKINGIVETYTASGNITIGSFVKLANNKVQIATQSDKILGIAQNKALDGQTVKVVRPDKLATIELDMVLNTGESKNYGFDLDTDNYYVSKNNAVNNSYSKCRLNVKTNVPITLNITSNSYSEKNYDYGLISNLDTALSANNTADTTYKAKIESTSATDYTTTTFNIDGDEIEHFIEFKYIKDGSGNKNNDNFKFKYDYIIEEEN